MEKDKRFEVKFTQGVLRGFQVIVDKNTGVNVSVIKKSAEIFADF
ncbi:MAG: hypothetical protein PUE01_03080 [Clostridiaceae bacterium]|nr:hypothetical protein [Clostridiaceae bacterium]